MSAIPHESIESILYNIALSSAPLCYPFSILYTTVNYMCILIGIATDSNKIIYTLLQFDNN